MSNKLRSLKVKEETYRSLLLKKSKNQLELKRCVPYDEIIQKFLKEGTISLSIPAEFAERLKKQCQRIYGTKTLEEGIQKILEWWLKKRRKEKSG